MTDFPWTADGSRAIKLMLHGLSNYVEASSPPNDEFHRALYFEAWKLLRTLLVMIFNRFCQCHREYYCQQKNSRESDMLMSKEVKEQWEARNKLNQGFRMFQVANSVLKGMAMNGFDFDTLLPRTAVEMKKWVADGTVPDLNCIFSILVIRYASELAVLADSRRKLNAQRLGGVDVQALFPMVHCSGIAEKLDVFRCLEWLKSELEQSVEQAAVMKEIKDHVLVIKESYGRVQHSYDQALYELGVLVSLTRNRDVDRPWTPYGIDAVHPELGAFSSPPGTWWKVFPQVRRQRWKECLEEEECQEPLNAFRVSHPDSTHKDSKLKRVRFQD